jgi:hypothetical protein
VDRVTACQDASAFERGFDPTGFADTAALLRRGAALLTHDSSRREALEEYAALHDFLAEKFPPLKEEWLAHRASLRGADSEERSGSPQSDRTPPATCPCC